MASRKKNADSAAGSGQPGPSFEEALEQLEQLVESMENEQLPLEELVANYEKGSKLLAHCQGVLDSARERIELITLGNQDKSALENSGSSTDGGAAASASDDDDIRLF